LEVLQVQDLKVLKDLPVDLKEIKALRERKVVKVLKETWDLRDIKVIRETREHKVFKEI
jgi:hypothetical protein